MRDDMHKVIVERPRFARFGASKIKLRKDRGGEEARSSIGLRRHVQTQSYSQKDLSDNLRPLARFLWKQRGRPWNKVFSEICAGAKLSNPVQRHLRDHLSDLVMLELSRGRHGEWLYCGRPITGVHYAPLYVDPRDGLLKDSAPFLRKFGRKHAPAT